MELRINSLMTFAELQRSGRAEGGRWSSTAVPRPGLADSSIKSQRSVRCGQTRRALVSLYIQDIGENRTLIWLFGETRECREERQRRAQDEGV